MPVNRDSIWERIRVCGVFEGISESMSWKKHEAGRGLEGNLYETNEA